jgi:hypothetical protein
MRRIVLQVHSILDICTHIKYCHMHTWCSERAYGSIVSKWLHSRSSKPTVITPTDDTRLTRRYRFDRRVSCVVNTKPNSPLPSPRATMTSKPMTTSTKHHILRAACVMIDWRSPTTLQQQQQLPIQAAQTNVP